MELFLARYGFPCLCYVIWTVIVKLLLNFCRNANCAANFTCVLVWATANRSTTLKLTRIPTRQSWSCRSVRFGWVEWLFWFDCGCSIWSDVVCCTCMLVSSIFKGIRSVSILSDFKSWNLFFFKSCNFSHKRICLFLSRFQASFNDYAIKVAKMLFYHTTSLGEIQYTTDTSKLCRLGFICIFTAFLISLTVNYSSLLSRWRCCALKMSLNIN